MAVANTIPGVDAHLDEELLVAPTTLVCGNCNKRMEQVTSVSFRCPGCGETFTRETK